MFVKCRGACVWSSKVCLIFLPVFALTIFTEESIALASDGVFGRSESVINHKPARRKLDDIGGNCTFIAKFQIKLVLSWDFTQSLACLFFFYGFVYHYAPEPLNKQDSYFFGVSIRHPIIALIIQNIWLGVDCALNFL